MGAGMKSTRNRMIYLVVFVVYINIINVYVYNTFILGLGTLSTREISSSLQFYRVSIKVLHAKSGTLPAPANKFTPRDLS